MFLTNVKIFHVRLLTVFTVKMSISGGAEQTAGTRNLTVSDFEGDERSYSTWVDLSLAILVIKYHKIKTCLWAPYQTIKLKKKPIAY